MSRHAHEQSLHRWTPQKAKPHGMEAQIRAVLFFGNWRTCMLKWPGRLVRRFASNNRVADKALPLTGPHQRPRTAALSGSNPKAPGSAGGYLLARATSYTLRASA